MPGSEDVDVQINLFSLIEVAVSESERRESFIRVASILIARHTLR